MAWFVAYVVGKANAHVFRVACYVDNLEQGCSAKKRERGGEVQDMAEIDTTLKNQKAADAQWLPTVKSVLIAHI